MSTNITIDNLYSVGLSKFEKTYEKMFGKNNYVKNDEIKIKLKNLFDTILNNNDINLVYFDMILINAISMNINPFEIVYQSFNDKCMDIHNLFLNDIINKNFTNKKFTEVYSEYIKNCIFIKKLFFKLNKLCKNKNENEKKINTIYILSNYAFYKHIFDKKYYDKYINDYIELKNVNTTDNLDVIINVIKIFGFYSNFIKLLKSDNIKLYDYDVTFNNNLIDINIYESVVKQIDFNIRNFKNENLEKSNIESFVSNSINCIKIFSDTNDNYNFMILYKTYLKQRLLNKFDNEIENILLNSFSNKSSIDIFIQMKLMINDMINSQQITKLFKNNNLKINVVSEKYKNVNPADINHSITYLNQYLWEDYYCTNNLINIPESIDFYIAIYRKLIEKLFNDKRTFDINYNKSIITFDIDINNVTYNVKSNLIQYILLNKIITSDNYDINLVHNDFGLIPKDINSEINSLLKSKLVLKSKNSTDNLVINFNNSYVSDNKYINLVELYEKAELFLTYRKTFNDTECKAAIYNIFHSNQNTKFTLNELSDKLFDMHIAVLGNELNKFIDELINTNIIVNTDSKYKFIPKHNEFDSDVEEEVEEVEEVRIPEVIVIEETQEEKLARYNYIEQLLEKGYEILNTSRYDKHKIIYNIMSLDLKEILNILQV